MKLTKRMKSAIIQSSIANVIFLILLIGAIAFFIVPRIKNITSLKTNLGEIYTEYNTIENA